MTHFEQLIQDAVSRSAVTTLDRATEKIAEEMAREILRDPAFRQEMQTWVRRAFRTTMSQLASETEPEP